MSKKKSLTVGFAAFAAMQVATAVGASPSFASEYVIEDLGTLPGVGASSSAEGINDLGEVTGSSRLPGSSQAFLFSGGTMKGLGTLGGDHAEGLAINDFLQIAGWSTAKTGYQEPF